MKLDRVVCSQNRTRNSLWIFTQVHCAPSQKHPVQIWANSLVVRSFPKLQGQQGGREGEGCRPIPADICLCVYKQRETETLRADGDLKTHPSLIKACRLAALQCGGNTLCYPEFALSLVLSRTHAAVQISSMVSFQEKITTAHTHTHTKHSPPLLTSQL